MDVRLNPNHLTPIQTEEAQGQGEPERTQQGRTLSRHVWHHASLVAMNAVNDLFTVCFPALAPSGRTGAMRTLERTLKTASRIAISGGPIFLKGIRGGLTTTSLLTVAGGITSLSLHGANALRQRQSLSLLHGAFQATILVPVFANVHADKTLEGYCTIAFSQVKGNFYRNLCHFYREVGNFHSEANLGVCMALCYYWMEKMRESDFSLTAIKTEIDNLKHTVIDKENPPEYVILQLSGNSRPSGIYNHFHEYGLGLLTLPDNDVSLFSFQLIEYMVDRKIAMTEKEGPIFADLFLDGWLGGHATVLCVQNENGKVAIDYFDPNLGHYHLDNLSPEEAPQKFSDFFSRLMAVSSYSIGFTSFRGDSIFCPIPQSTAQPTS